MKTISNINLGIGIPLSHPYVHSAFLDSMMLLDIPKEVRTFSYIRVDNGAGGVAGMRNEIVERAFITGCTHLIMMDSDMIYPHDTLVKLLGHRLPVVSALIWRRYPSFDPILYKGDLNKYTLISEWEDGELLEIDATGTGCILYEMDVFNKIPRPWFEFKENPDKEVGGGIGEDIGFCFKLRQAGYKIFTDTSVETQHLTIFSVNRQSWEMYKMVDEMRRRQMVKVAEKSK